MFRSILLFLVCLSTCLAADQSKNEQKKNRICLNMIVKDEAPIIERCLGSLKHYIDYWVIVDTGSTDGTQKVIKEYLKDIPGELHERPWVNFGLNRQQALDLARNKSDYILFMDADERLQFPPNFVKPDYRANFYFSTFIDPEDNVEFPKILMIDNNPGWNWKGVIHEYLTTPDNVVYDTINDITCLRATSTSNRSQDPQKYYKDAKLLEEDLIKDPDNPRSVFYLAQSYCNAGEYDLALKNYERRMNMRGVDHEGVWSAYIVGRLHEILQHCPEQIINSYSLAYQRYPNRAEPLFRLSDYFIRNQNFVLAYLTAKQAVNIPEPTGAGVGYVEHWAYDYGIKLLYANAAFMLGHFDEATPILIELQDHKGVNDAFKEGIRQRLAFIKERQVQLSK